jgi:hypothetical protein
VIFTRGIKSYAWGRVVERRDLEPLVVQLNIRQLAGRCKPSRFVKRFPQAGEALVEIGARRGLHGQPEPVPAMLIVERCTRHQVFIEILELLTYDILSN